MVQHVRIVRHVEHDVEHQFVVRLRAVVEQRELVLEQVQKTREVDVLGVPEGEGVGHGAGFLGRRFAAHADAHALQSMLRQDALTAKRAAGLTFDLHQELRAFGTGAVTPRRGGGRRLRRPRPAGPAGATEPGAAAGAPYDA